MNDLSRTILIAFISVLLLASPTLAARVTFIGSDPSASSTDPRPSSNAAAAAFDAAAGLMNLINFESASLGPIIPGLMIAPGVTLTGVAVGGSDQEIRNSPHGGDPENIAGYNTTAGGANFASLAGGALTFTFATPINAFGLYFTGVQSPDGGPVNIQYSNGTQVIQASMVGSVGGVQFVGFTDVGAMITSVTIDAQGDIIGVDDVRYGSVAVPECSTMALSLLALAFCAVS